MPPKRPTLHLTLFLTLLPALLLALAGGCSQDKPAEPAYLAEINQWHAERIAALRSDTGWLTLAGLHELKEGLSTLGSAPERDVVMTAKAPPYLGDVAVLDGEVMFAAAKGVAVTLFKGDTSDPVSHVAMASDRVGRPTMLACGTLVFFVIDRDGRLFLRVKDQQADLLTTFQGIERYPIQAGWRVMAHLEPGPATTAIPNVLGQESQAPSPGVLVFTLQGKACRLTPTTEGDGLFLVFGDATNGKGTYHGGRFLDASAPTADGTVILDFNKATNPPCVFTEYATCPLPPKGNILPVAVEAGEKMWGGHP